MLDSSNWSHDRLVSWLRETDPVQLSELWDGADGVRRERCGDQVNLRGLIEVSNHCVKRCSYCGISASVPAVARYTLFSDEIFEAAERAAAAGCDTIVLQGGETKRLSTDTVSRIVRRIKRELGLAVTLSLGERSIHDLTNWRAAGADRYLLRFETSDRRLFGAIHPEGDSSLEGRLQALRRLRRLDYEVGSGVMVGIPGQSYDSLATDLELFATLGLQMVGVGPYIPHPATALGRGEIAPPIVPHEQVPASLEMGLKVIALARLLLPAANIPSTTALNTLDPECGLERGLRAGANVLMPNFTPEEMRQQYQLYPEKASIAAESIDRRLARIDRRVKPVPGKMPALVATGAIR